MRHSRAEALVFALLLLLSSSPAAQGREKGAVIVIDDITNNDPQCAGEYPVKWEILTGGDYVDYASTCLEENANVLLTIEQGLTYPGLRCTSASLPDYYSGPHTARISWCTGTVSFQYGCALTCDKAALKASCGSWSSSSTGEYCEKCADQDEEGCTKLQTLSADAVSLVLGDERGGDDETDDDGAVWAKAALAPGADKVPACEIEWGDGKEPTKVAPCKLAYSSHTYSEDKSYTVTYSCETTGSGKIKAIDTMIVKRSSAAATPIAEEASLADLKPTLLVEIYKDAILSKQGDITPSMLAGKQGMTSLTILQTSLMALGFLEKDSASSFGSWDQETKDAIARLQSETGIAATGDKITPETIDAVGFLLFTDSLNYPRGNALRSWKDGHDIAEGPENRPIKAADLKTVEKDNINLDIYDCGEADNPDAFCIKYKSPGDEGGSSGGEFTLKAAPGVLTDDIHSEIRGEGAFSTDDADIIITAQHSDGDVRQMAMLWGAKGSWTSQDDIRPLEPHKDIYAEIHLKNKRSYKNTGDPMGIEGTLHISINYHTVPSGIKTGLQKLRDYAKDGELSSAEKTTILGNMKLVKDPTTGQSQEQTEQPQNQEDNSWYQRLRDWVSQNAPAPVVEFLVRLLASLQTNAEQLGTLKETYSHEGVDFSVYEHGSVIKADPQKADVKPLSALRFGSQGMSLPSLLQSSGAIAGVNGDFFYTETYYTWGPLIIDGQEIFPIKNDDTMIAGGFMVNKQGEISFVRDITQKELKSRYGDTIQQFMGSYGSRMLVTGGEIDDQSIEKYPFPSQDNTLPYSRSAICMTGDKKIMMVATIVQGHIQVITGKNFAQALKDLGCVDAMELDGGNSISIGIVPEDLEGSRSLPCAIAVFPKQGADTVECME